MDRFGVILRLQKIAGTLQPIAGVLVESVEDAWLKSLEDHAIGTLDLTVSTWMSDRGPVDPNAVSITEV